jgi:hypothetical protein
MGHPRRRNAELPTERFIGPRWMIAMWEAEWSVFQNAIEPEANERLTVILESFCEEGDSGFPRGRFRWFAPSVNDPPGVEIGAFEARGVVIHGRRAFSNGRDAFFVTKITIDTQPTPARGRRSRISDERQCDLPFDK